MFSRVLNPLLARRQSILSLFARQVITNIISNAAKFTPSMGEIAVKARLTTRKRTRNSAEDGLDFCVKHGMHGGEWYYRIQASSRQK